MQTQSKPVGNMNEHNGHMVTPEKNNFAHLTSADLIEDVNQ